jgi:hypothetical protein
MRTESDPVWELRGTKGVSPWPLIVLLRLIRLLSTLLQVPPAPSRVVRVFVGRIELITPENKLAVDRPLSRAGGRQLIATAAFWTSF